MSAASPRPIRSFVASVRAEPDANPAFPGADLEEIPEVAEASGGRLRLAVSRRRGSHRGDESGGWLVGDAAEWEPSAEPRCLANATSISIDTDGDALRILTSLVGLPPVFLLERPGWVVASSDLHRLAKLPGIDLRFDPRAVGELARIGHPIGGRTLFRDVRMVSAGCALRLTPGRDPECVHATGLDTTRPAADTEAFLELQIEAFERSVARLDLSRSFLSLTAGLDTRALFAVLARDGRLVPAATLSGEVLSLDARIARRLCTATGVEHRLISFGDAFERVLPKLVREAIRLSGGLGGLEQTPEVHFYHELGDAYAARVSGNLGNQIGRGGTEGLSQRGADLALLSPALREDAPDPGAEHWLHAASRERPRAQVLLEQEIPYTSVGNYGIGNHFAVQQTPYGSRDLIEALLRRPVTDREADPSSVLRMRLRDLRHRFLGEPEALSFQRRLIRRIGGPAATLPINWGWRAAGGISPRGALLGSASLLGMLATSRGWDEGRARAFWRHSRLVAIHDFRRMRAWLRGPLAELLGDTLSSRATQESGLFDVAVLGRLLDEHLAGSADHYDDLVLALDLALSRETFDASV